MADYFAYIRVSTARQGQNGTSLVEQRAAIERYAQKYNLKIVKEFEEQETAAKRGRPVFLEMIKFLRQRRASGVIMHKIDRSARNLRDWAELGELIDKGIEVHFANENLDLYSRGGRLSADIQAVVAADYIRNLREEVKKGFYGRLKQGFYPMPAPVGYLNRGAGEAKAIDPVQSSLVKTAFELYATGNYGLRYLATKLKEMGLQSRHGQTVSAKRLGELLRNPFYTGVIHLKKTGEFYQGQHLPIISKKLFEKTQDVLDGKIITAAPSKRTLEDVFLFRKLLFCDSCRYRLIGERQKDYHYYRCHTSDCPQKTIREELVEKPFIEVLLDLRFTGEETEFFNEWYRQMEGKIEETVVTARKTLKLQLDQTQSRLSRLTDALMDDVIDEKLFTRKKNDLILLERDLKERLRNVETDEPKALQKTEKFLELANSVYSSYKKGTFEKKRDLVKTVTSNFFINREFVLIKLNLPFKMVVNRWGVRYGGPHRRRPRTFLGILSNIYTYFREDGRD